MGKRLSAIGLEKVNEINFKYGNGITMFEITDMEEFDQWKTVFFNVVNCSNIISKEDIDIVNEMIETIHKSEQ